MWVSGRLADPAEAAPSGGDAQKNRNVSLCYKTVIQETRKNFRLFGKIRLQAPGGIRKRPLTGGAEAHDGTPDGAAASGNAGPAQTRRTGNSRDGQAGAPEVRAHWSGFVSHAL